MSDIKGLVDSKGRSAVGDSSVFDMVFEGENMKVSEETEQQVHELMKLMTDKDELKSQYILDIYFNDERSHFHPFGGFLMAWTNGGAFHGGGDEKVYFCPQKVDRGGHERTCAAPIAPNLLKHNIAICIECQRPTEDKKLIGEVYFKLPMESWPIVMEKYFHRLGCNADLRLGLLHGDLRVATNEEQERAMRGDKVNKVRKDRRFVRYSLKSLVRDGLGGATLLSRFNAFLRA